MFKGERSGAEGGEGSQGIPMMITWELKGGRGLGFWFRFLWGEGED